VAAHGYKLVEGKVFDAVIVIAPSHHAAFSGCSIYEGTAYRTPLGLAEIHTDLAGNLLEGYDFIISNPVAHMREHSLEVQIPFLQVAVSNLRFVPIVMGDQSLATCKRLAEAIAETTKGMNVLIVASSDLSHFHSYDRAVELDSLIVERVLREVRSLRRRPRHYGHAGRQAAGRGFGRDTQVRQLGRHLRRQVQGSRISLRGRV
jgi:AmmeMemoRadiSam system protein B